MAAKRSSRRAFAADCKRKVDEFGLDGIDIDWEYPTVSDAGISAAPEDTRNFTLLIRDLREMLGTQKELTIASVASAEYIDFPSVVPYLDFVNIMAYDMARAPQHHSALYPSEHSGTMTADGAVRAHLAAGVPREKSVLGMPFYGRGGEGYPDFQDFGRINEEHRFTECWDSVAQVPYLADHTGKPVAGYENPRSLAVKCRYIREQGLRGGMYWEYAGDNATGDLRRTVAAELLQAVDSVRPASYARGPRFKALIYHSDEVEPAHRQFNAQAVEFFRKLNYGEGFELDITTDFASFDAAELSRYDVVVMLNSLPQTPSERAAFETYMEHGGGWVGFHAAAYNDARTGWSWLNRFLGCGTFFCNNWPPQSALLSLDTAQHPVTKNLPAEFIVPASEWYQWNPSPRLDPDVEVLVSLSPKNYPLGIKDIVFGGDSPVVWTNRRYRMIYLNMGHGNEAFTDGVQNLLFLNAFRWIVSTAPNGNPFER